MTSSDKPLRVIGSGFGRTGTLSLKHALEELGFGPCYHMQEVIKNRSQVNLWHQVAHGRRIDWAKMYAGYNSAVDFPTSVVYQELMDVFPDAKIIHTVRDPQRWYDSTSQTIYNGGSLLPRWMHRVIPATGRWVEMSEMLIWDRLFDGKFEDRDWAIERFSAWTDEVVATVPPDRLLVFDVSQGWGPLCEFLGVLQPDAPFPHVNDRRSMQRRLRMTRAISRAFPAAIVGLITGAYAVIRRFRRR